MSKRKQCTKCNIPIGEDYTMCSHCYYKYTENTKQNHTVDYQDFVNINTLPSDRKIYRIGDIWENSIECLECGDKVRSINEHDKRSCKCRRSWVDGGSWQQSRGGPCRSIAVQFKNLHPDEE